MKSNVLAILAFLAAFTFPSFATEHNKSSLPPDYLKIEVGYGAGIDYSGTYSDGDTYESEIDNFTVFGLGIGTYFGEGMRFEVLGNYTEAGDRSGSIENNSVSIDFDDDYILSLSLNVYRDFVGSESVRPYIGGGIGYGLYNYSGTLTYQGSTFGVDDDDSWFILNAGAGVCITLSQNSCLEIGYRANYYDPGDPDLVHEGRIGLRISSF